MTKTKVSIIGGGAIGQSLAHIIKKIQQQKHLFTVNNEMQKMAVNLPYCRLQTWQVDLKN